jgi:Leucine-rich repeat (LRR) protein
MKLDLSHNKLKSLDNIKPTPCLQILYAAHNKIENIPPDLNNNVSLQVLDLNHNLISDITSLHSLPNIISLDLGHNGIREVPSQLFTLHNLEVLNLANNVIQVFPKGVIKLRKLMFLFLQGNKLKSIPSEIGELKYLEELNLKDNDIAILPLTLGKLISHLKELRLDGNNQMTIPNSLIRKQGTKAVLTYLNQEEEALGKIKKEKNRIK